MAILRSLNRAGRSWSCFCANLRTWMMGGRPSVVESRVDTMLELIELILSTLPWLNRRVGGSWYHGSVGCKLTYLKPWNVEVARVRRRRRHSWQDAAGCCRMLQDAAGGPLPQHALPGRRYRAGIPGMVHVTSACHCARRAPSAADAGRPRWTPTVTTRWSVAVCSKCIQGPWRPDDAR